MVIPRDAFIIKNFYSNFHRRMKKLAFSDYHVCYQMLYLRFVVSASIMQHRSKLLTWSWLVSNVEFALGVTIVFVIRMLLFIYLSQSSDRSVNDGQQSFKTLVKYLNIFIWSKILQLFDFFFVNVYVKEFKIKFNHSKQNMHIISLMCKKNHLIFYACLSQGSLSSKANIPLV